MLLKEVFDTMKNVNFQYHDSLTSLMEGVLARGDRRLSKAIYLAFRDGARFDSWSEHFSFDRWKKAIEGAGLDMAFYNNRPRGKMRSFLGSTRAAAFPVASCGKNTNGPRKLL